MGILNIGSLAGAVRYALGGKRGNIRTYRQRVIASLSAGLIGYYQLAHDARDYSGNGRNGLATAVTFNQPGMAAREYSAAWNGSTSVIDLYGASFAAAFNGAAGTVDMWIKFDPSVWSAAAQKRAFYFAVDANNLVSGRVSSTPNVFDFLYKAGGTQVVQQTTALSGLTGWAHLAITWDKAADAVWCYINGIPVDVRLTGLGTWAGALASTNAVIGSIQKAVAAQSMLGNIEDVGIWNYAFSRRDIARLASPVFQTRVSDAVATIADNGQTSPAWLSSDGATLFGVGYPGYGNTALCVSTNGGATWTRIYAAPSAINHGGVRQLANGELLVSVSAAGGVPGSLYLSTNYPALGAGASWAKVLDCAGGVNSSIDGLWGMSTYGTYAVACEYGLQNVGDKGRYVYLSTNSGATWSTMLDIGNAANVHTHGAAYDRWWDAIWFVGGDGANRITKVSFDHGQNWTTVDTAIQFVAILPMPDCVLFLTDTSSTGANGVYHISRANGTGTLTLELAYRLDWSTNLTQIGSQPFRIDTPGMPALLPFISNGVGYGRILATRDGWTFTDLWMDSITYNTSGPYTLLGPTIQGTLVGDLADGRQTNHSKITFPATAV